jgi:hypothetical protein
MCTSCAAVQPADARFCAECGTPMTRAADGEGLIPSQRAVESIESIENPAEPSVAASAPPVSGNGLPAVGPTSRRRMMITVVAGVAVLAAVAVLALNDRGTHSRLAASRAAFASSQGHLKATKAELATTVAELIQTKSDLTTANGDLETTKATLAATQKSLAAKEQDLVGVRNNLNQVKNSVTIQAAQIETLKSCLNGVSIALSDAAYGDYSSAIAALDAVRVSCNAAYDLL